jgi:hypothetical protein
LIYNCETENIFSWPTNISGLSFMSYPYKISNSGFLLWCLTRDICVLSSSYKNECSLLVEFLGEWWCLLALLECLEPL